MTEYTHGLSHIGVAVSDLQATKGYYTEKLGFLNLHENLIDTPKGPIWVAFLGSGSLVIEFLQFPPGLGPPPGTIDHIAVKVVGIEGAAADLRERGIPFDTEEVQSLMEFWQRGTKWLTFRGPDGEKLEINEVL